MAMVKCKECGNDVSTSASACQKCGAKPPKKTSVVTLVIGGGFALAVFGMVISANSERQAQPVKSAAQIALEAKKSAAFAQTVLVLSALKASLRAPDSLTFESIRANDDASIVCVEYRAQNGFGGLNKEILVYAKGKATNTPAAWNKNCTQSLFDMGHARLAI